MSVRVARVDEFTPYALFPTPYSAAIASCTMVWTWV